LILFFYHISVCEVWVRYT